MDDPSNIWRDRARSRFGTLAAIDVGQGPLVLLLHGVGLRAEAWGAQIDALAPRFRVIAPDMAGHGDSPAVQAAGLADFAAPLVDALTEPAVVVGHSMGAMLTLELARVVPDKVRAVAALNAIYRRDATAAKAVQARAAALGETVPDPEPTLSRWFADHPSPERSACRTWLTQVSPLAYKAAYTVFAHSDGPADDTLDSLRIPALFMTGADEPNSTPAMSRAMAARAPKGTALIVPDAAHMMPMTHAAAVTDAITKLIADTKA